MTTTGQRNQTRGRESASRPARVPGTSSDAMISLPLDAAPSRARASAKSGAAPGVAAKKAGRRGTLDDRVRDWWTAQPGDSRRGYFGGAMLMIGIVCYAALVSRDDTRSALAGLGLTLESIWGWGAYPLMALIGVYGAGQIATSMMHRQLVRGSLLLRALALWLVLEAGSAFVFGGSTGGTTGALLAKPLDGLPIVFAVVLVLALIVGLLMSLCAIRPSDVSYMIGVAHDHVRTHWHAGDGDDNAVGSDNGDTGIGEVDGVVSADMRVALPGADAALVAPESVALPLGALKSALDSGPSQPGLPNGAQRVAPVGGNATPALAPRSSRWALPPLDLFDSSAQAAPPASTWVEGAARRLEAVLRSLHIEATVATHEVTYNAAVLRLPVVLDTRIEHDARGYAVIDELGRPRVRQASVQQLLAAQADLALAFGSQDVRVIAPATPVAGRPQVELPRPDRPAGALFDMLVTSGFQQVAGRSHMAIAVGIDTFGQARVADLARSGSVLVAGPGSAGYLRGMLATLLSQQTPDDLRLLVVPSQRTALADLSDLPHLLQPVHGGGAEVATAALERVLGEVSWRARHIAQSGFAGFRDYQRAVALGAPVPPLPALLVVVEDGAQLLAGPRQMETARTLAQLVERAGDNGLYVIVGAEAPGAVGVAEAFATVAARIPASMALDGVPAGAGRTSAVVPASVSEFTLVYAAGDGCMPERVRGVYVTEAEVLRLMRFWRQQAGQAMSAAPDPFAAPRPSVQSAPVGTVSRPSRPQVPVYGSVDASLAGVASQGITQQVLPPNAPTMAWLPPLPMQHGAAAPSAQATAPRAQPPAPTDDRYASDRYATVGAGAMTQPAAARVAEPVPLPDGWTPEMIQVMAQFIQAALRNGQGAPASPSRPGTTAEEERR